MSRLTHAVKAIIFNEKQEVLLLQRNPKVREASNWDLPGGLVENEDEQAALRRELKEELQVEAEIFRTALPWKFFRPTDEQWVTVSTYICGLKNGIIHLSEEHCDYQWVSQENIRNFPVKDPSLYDVLEKEWKL